VARFIIRSFVFLIVSLLILVGIHTISTYDNSDRYSSSNSNIISLQIKSDYDNLDILFVGNSYCYSGVQPVLLDSIGLKSYNLGIATAGVEFYDLIINDYLEQVNNYPKTIFILLSPMTFSSRSDNFSSYPIHRYLKSPFTNLELASKYKRYNDLVEMYKKSFKKSIVNIAAGKGKSSQSESLAKSKGFVGSGVIVTPLIIDNDKYLYQPLISDKYEKTKVNFLFDMIKALQEKDIKIVFFELPANILNDYFNKDYLLSYEQVLNDIEKEHLLLRINESLFSDSNYRNIDHLNNSGSIIATNELIGFIKKNKDKLGLILKK